MEAVMQNYCSVAYGVLVRCAVAKTIIKGNELAIALNLPERGEMTQSVIKTVLDEISKAERTKQRPPLTALMVKEGCRPGPGLFTMLDSFGYDIKRTSSDKDKMNLWLSIREDIYIEWSL